MLWVSSMMVPPINQNREVALFSLVMLFGVACFVWSWRSFSWASRFASTALIAVVFFGIGIRAWAALLDGFWLWAVTASLALLFCMAWILPSVAPAASESIWRLQSTPQTRTGRSTLKWVLRLGLGGAGVLGASAGMSLMRAGAVSLAYLLVALGMSVFAILIAQGFSHQLWPYSPWAKRAGQLGKHDKG
jgi:hypothetical protein